MNAIFIALVISGIFCLMGLFEWLSNPRVHRYMRQTVFHYRDRGEKGQLDAGTVAVVLAFVLLVAGLVALGASDADASRRPFHDSDKQQRQVPDALYVDHHPHSVSLAEAKRIDVGDHYRITRIRYFTYARARWNSDTSRDISAGNIDNTLRLRWRVTGDGHHRITRAVWITCPPYEGPEQPGWPCTSRRLA